MDYIITRAKDGKVTHREKYTNRTAVIKKFEQMVGRTLNSIIMDTPLEQAGTVDARASDGATILLRVRA